MRLLTYEKNNKEIEIDFDFQITSWMGSLALPLKICWWSTKDVMNVYNFMFTVDVLCFSLHFEYWNFGEK